MGSELFHADLQMDMKLRVAFCNFAQAPRKAAPLLLSLKASREPEFKNNCTTSFRAGYGLQVNAHRPTKRVEG